MCQRSVKRRNSIGQSGLKFLTSKIGSTPSADCCVCQRKQRKKKKDNKEIEKEKKDKRKRRKNKEVFHEQSLIYKVRFDVYIKNNKYLNLDTVRQKDKKHKEKKNKD